MKRLSKYSYLGDEVGGGARFHGPHVLAPGPLDDPSQLLFPVFAAAK